MKLSTGMLMGAATIRSLRHVATMARSGMTFKLLMVGGILSLSAGLYLAIPRLDVEELLNPDRLAARLRTAGPFGPALFILLMATTVVISPIPSLPLDLTAGALFGVLSGTAYSVIGAEIGAIVSFLIGRSLGREALARILRVEVSFCERCSDRHLALFVFLARLFPVFSFDLVSYGAGLTNMSLRSFALATLAGMILPTFALTYTGRSLASTDWLVILLGSAMVVFLLLIPQLAVRHRSSRWVRLLRGEPCPVGDQERQPTGAEQPVTGREQRCSSCGGAME